MAADIRCMGCMSELNDGPVCAVCGWRDGQPLETPFQLPPRTILAGQYLIGRALGHGGFGIVYLAWDVNLQLKLAIKEYLPGDYATRSADGTSVTPYSGPAREYFEYGLTKFLDEGRAVARFNDHPGIVPVLNFFRANRTGYLVMSYVPGRTLKEHLIARGGRLSHAETLAIAMPVMDTLRTVHEVGLLHRDISPDNIYISHTKQVKLLDFGAARISLGDKSKSLSVILKAGYAPKEQYQTKGRQGPWTDVYALGATMYRSLTGEPPPESLDRNERDDMAPPRSFGADIPPAAEAVLLRALAVDAAARFQTVSEFQQAMIAVSRFSPSDQDDARPDEIRPIQGGPRAPAPAELPSVDVLEKVVAASLPAATFVNDAVARLGFRPAPVDQAALRQAAVVVSFFVGALGAWASLSALMVSAALPGALAPLTAATGIAALIGNVLLLVGSYLSAKSDARGPGIVWAAAWELAAVAVLGFTLFFLNFSSVAPWALAWQLAQPQFNTLILTLLLLGAVLVLYAKRTA